MAVATNIITQVNTYDIMQSITSVKHGIQVSKMLALPIRPTTSMSHSVVKITFITTQPTGAIT